MCLAVHVSYFDWGIRENGPNEMYLSFFQRKTCVLVNNSRLKIAQELKGCRIEAKSYLILIKNTSIVLLSLKSFQRLSEFDRAQFQA